MKGLSKKQETSIARLKELGLDVIREQDYFEVDIPSGTDISDGVEIGFLLAQLTDHDYPTGFGPLGGTKSNVYQKIDKAPPVHFVDSYPHGLKYRVYKKGK